MLRLRLCGVLHRTLLLADFDSGERWVSTAAVLCFQMDAFKGMEELRSPLLFPLCGSAAQLHPPASAWQSAQAGG